MKKQKLEPGASFNKKGIKKESKNCVYEIVSKNMLDYAEPLSREYDMEPDALKYLHDVSFTKYAAAHDLLIMKGFEQVSENEYLAPIQKNKSGNDIMIRSRYTIGEKPTFGKAKEAEAFLSTDRKKIDTKNRFLDDANNGK